MNLISYILFLLILFLNLISLLPFSLSFTSQLSVTLFFSLGFFFGGVRFYIYYNFSNFVCDLCPVRVGYFLSFLLIIIETLSFIIRPIALFLRLFANITAGHILINFIISSLSIYLFILVIPLVALEIAVSIIQSYIFVLLLTLWSNDLTK